MDNPEYVYYREVLEFVAKESYKDNRSLARAAAISAWVYLFTNFSGYARIECTACTPPANLYGTCRCPVNGAASNMEQSGWRYFVVNSRHYPLGGRIGEWRILRRDLVEMPEERIAQAQYTQVKWRVVEFLRGLRTGT